jgi:hypothetical protein
MRRHKRWRKRDCRRMACTGPMGTKQARRVAGRRIRRWRDKSCSPQPSIPRAPLRRDPGAPPCSGHGGRHSRSSGCLLLLIRPGDVALGREARGLASGDSWRCGAAQAWRKARCEAGGAGRRAPRVFGQPVPWCGTKDRWLAGGAVQSGGAGTSRMRVIQLRLRLRLRDRHFSQCVDLVSRA